MSTCGMHPHVDGSNQLHPLIQMWIQREPTPWQPRCSPRSLIRKLMHGSKVAAPIRIRAAHSLQLTWFPFIWIRLPAYRLWFHWWASSSLFSCYSYFLILFIVFGLKQTSSRYFKKVEFVSRLMINGPTGSQIVGTSSDHLFLGRTLSSTWTPKHSAHIVFLVIILWSLLKTTARYGKTHI